MVLQNSQCKIIKAKKKCKSAPPGNRTRGARMGILHVTITPAALFDLCVEKLREDEKSLSAIVNRFPHKGLE